MKTLVKQIGMLHVTRAHPHSYKSIYEGTTQVKKDVQKLRFYDFSKDGIGLDQRRENFYRALSHLT